MFRATGLLLVLLAAGAAAPASASVLPQLERARDLREATDGAHGAVSIRYLEIEPGVRFAVRGARERRQVRFARWLDQLAGDRLAVYRSHGYPVYRYRLDDGGRVTEVWRYPDRNRQFHFRGDRLLRSRID